MPVQQDDINDVVFRRKGWLVWEDGFWTDKMRRKTCMACVPTRAQKTTPSTRPQFTPLGTQGNQWIGMTEKWLQRWGPLMTQGCHSSVGRAQHGNPGKQARFHLWDSVADEANALTNVRLLFLCEGDRPYHSTSSFLHHSWLFLELSLERSWFLKRAVSSKTTFIK